jgi:coatomer subunit beta
VPSILANLEHRHSYVRKNTVAAVDAIYKLPKGEMLLQDAPEAIEKFLQHEQDLSSKRNAFTMLVNHAHDRAIRYLFDNIEAIANWGDILQMSVLELIRKVGAEPGAERVAAGARPGARVGRLQDAPGHSFLSGRDEARRVSAAGSLRRLSHV